MRCRGERSTAGKVTQDDRDCGSGWNAVMGLLWSCLAGPPISVLGDTCWWGGGVRSVRYGLTRGEMDKAEDLEDFVCCGLALLRGTCWAGWGDGCRESWPRVDHQREKSTSKHEGWGGMEVLVHLPKIAVEAGKNAVNNQHYLLNASKCSCDHGWTILATQSTLLIKWKY